MVGATPLSSSSPSHDMSCHISDFVESSSSPSTKSPFGEGWSDFVELDLGRADFVELDRLAVALFSLGEFFVVFSIFL